MLYKARSPITERIRQPGNLNPKVHKLTQNKRVRPHNPQNHKYKVHLLLQWNYKHNSTLTHQHNLNTYTSIQDSPHKHK